MACSIIRTALARARFDDASTCSSRRQKEHAGAGAAWPAEPGATGSAPHRADRRHGLACSARGDFTQEGFEGPRRRSGARPIAGCCCYYGGLCRAHCRGGGALSADTAGQSRSRRALFRIRRDRPLRAGLRSRPARRRRRWARRWTCCCSRSPCAPTIGMAWTRRERADCPQYRRCLRHPAAGLRRRCGSCCPRSKS